MIFELTISGLCVVVLKSHDNEKMPIHPETVDVVCPKDGMHRARLCYSPNLIRARYAEPEMTVDTTGQRIASLDLADTFLELAFSSSPYENFTVGWGSDDVVKPPVTEWFNWAPTLTDLGFDGFTIGDPGDLPEGANTRLTLPKGELFCRNIVRDPVTNKLLIWQFPAADDKKRVVANEIVFRASGVIGVLFKNSDREIVLSGNPQNEDEVVRVSFCNDLSIVAQSYYNAVDSLKHLSHLDALAAVTNPPFKPPTLVPDLGQRTDSPICNITIHVDGYDGRGQDDCLSGR
jgi:hypothetical protein